MKGLYQRGGIWWFRWSNDGKQERRSLETLDEEEAITKAESILRSTGLGSDIKTFLFDRRKNEVSYTGPRRAAHVYLIRCHERFKIGTTTNLEKRKQAISAHSPYEAELVSFTSFASERTAFMYERKLHRKFKAYRLHFEWFALPSDAVTEIASLFAERSPVTMKQVTQ